MDPGGLRQLSGQRGTGGSNTGLDALCRAAEILHPGSDPPDALAPTDAYSSGLQASIGQNVPGIGGGRVEGAQVEGSDSEQTGGTVGSRPYPTYPKKTGRKRYRCESCVKLKVQCSKFFPCAKCYELCLNCVPPPTSGPPKPYLDMAISYQDHRTLNGMYMQALMRAYARPHFDLPRFKCLLMSWRDESQRAQRDITHGLLDDICRALQLSMTDLQPPQDEQIDNLGEWQDSVRRAVAETDQFKLLSDNESVLMIGVFYSHRMVTTVNETGGRLYASAEEIDEAVRAHGMVREHILASMISPEDRQHYYDTICGDLSTSPQPSNSMIKFCQREGDIDLFVLKHSLQYISEFPTHRASVLILTKVPNSRHIHKKGKHPHRVVQSFREAQQPFKPELQASGSGGSGGSANGSDSTAAGSVTLPSIAMLPFNQLPDHEVDSLLAQAPSSHIVQPNYGHYLVQQAQVEQRRQAQLQEYNHPVPTHPMMTEQSVMPPPSQQQYPGRIWYETYEGYDGFGR